MGGRGGSLQSSEVREGGLVSRKCSGSRCCLLPTPPGQRAPRPLLALASWQWHLFPTGREPPEGSLPEKLCGWRRWGAVLGDQKAGPLLKQQCQGGCLLSTACSLETQCHRGWGDKRGGKYIIQWILWYPEVEHSPLPATVPASSLHFLCSLLPPGAQPSPRLWVAMQPSWHTLTHG